MPFIINACDPMQNPVQTQIFHNLGKICLTRAKRDRDDLTRFKPCSTTQLLTPMEVLINNKNESLLLVKQYICSYSMFHKNNTVVFFQALVKSNAALKIEEFMRYSCTWLISMATSFLYFSVFLYLRCCIISIYIIFKISQKPVVSLGKD